MNIISRIPSYYYRSNSGRGYLEKSLNVTKMETFHWDICAENYLAHMKEPKCRKIFNIQFNIDLMAPQTNRCNGCDRLKLNPDLQGAIEEHLLKKNQTAMEREND